ncbi:hypothetical protein [Bacillus sp. Cr_A10]|uniref:hypothetical protein n=1 Tax=Bacillus sp. Cr_A10 TaxID=3033993 RepID=UPI0023DBDAF3|nr:hypothetical protein [Bacillus sp. Cr_A10]MDF2066908.1 hypothetical protein [Bacillus sp. Cr_A10]
MNRVQFFYLKVLEAGIVKAIFATGLILEGSLIGIMGVRFDKVKTMDISIIIMVLTLIIFGYSIWLLCIYCDEFAYRLLRTIGFQQLFMHLSRQKLNPIYLEECLALSAVFRN